MKKILFVAAALCTVFMFDSCKSKEDLYKTAYDEARQKEAEGQAQQNEFVEIAPVASTTKEVKEVDESYRTEKVVLSEGAEGSLKAYSVVCGSFGVKANADNLRKSLLGEGYNAIVVQNPATGMYRVVCASYDSRYRCCGSALGVYL
jgi:cell division protein FtsN